MIVVNAVVTSNAGDIAALRAAIGEMETASRAEAGCEDYTFSVELNDPGTVRITERWQSLEALMAHMQTPHMATFQKAMGAHPPSAMDIKFYEVKEIKPF
jgi:quinol monooxygenase YgiN